MSAPKTPPPPPLASGARCLDGAARVLAWDVHADYVEACVYGEGTGGLPLGWGDDLAGAVRSLQADARACLGGLRGEEFARQLEDALAAMAEEVEP